MDGEISGLQSKSDEEHKEAKETPFERSKRHQGIRESYTLYKQFSDRISALKSEIRRIDEDIRGRLEFSKRLTACKSVAEKAGEFKAILNAMRPHEEAIARKTEEELTKRDLSKMKPAEIDGVKAMAHFSYTNEHMDFDGLTKRRDEILGEIDSFRPAQKDKGPGRTNPPRPSRFIRRSHTTRRLSARPCPGCRPTRPKKSPRSPLR